MRFGLARDLITPDVVTHLGGYASYHNKTFCGLHDDVYVKTVLFDDGRSQVLMMALDLLFYEYALTEKIAAYLEERHGIPAEHLLVSYTHTHGAPAVRGYDIGLSTPAYEDFLWERIKSCIDRTFVNTFEGQVAWGAVEGHWNVNRRRMVNGRFENAPNYEGLRETSLNVLKISDDEGRIRGLLLNYGCHPVTVRDTDYVTAEYPGRLCQLLEAWFYGSMALFFQGAGGNSRPLATADGSEFKTCTYDELDDMALAMANNAQKLINSGNLQPLQLNLAARHFVIPLELVPYTKEYLQALVERGQDATLPERARSGAAFYANAARIVLENYDRTDNVVQLHASLIRLSDDLYIANMGGEQCYEIKELIEQVLGDRKVLLFGYGDNTAYVVDDKLLAEGGYEPESGIEYALKGNFKPGVDQKFLDAFRQNLQQLETT